MTDNCIKIFFRFLYCAGAIEFVAKGSGYIAHPAVIYNCMPLSNMQNSVYFCIAQVPSILWSPRALAILPTLQ